MSGEPFDVGAYLRRHPKPWSGKWSYGDYVIADAKGFRVTGDLHLIDYVKYLEDELKGHETNARLQ